MKFGEAVNLMQNSNKLVRRAGWNGKGMYLFYVADWDLNLTNTVTGEVAAREMPHIEFAPFICMRTADAKLVPWLASQTDILATDWEYL